MDTDIGMQIKTGKEKKLHESGTVLGSWEIVLNTKYYHIFYKNWVSIVFFYYSRWHFYM